MKQNFDEIPPEWQWRVGCMIGFLAIAVFLYLVYLAESWVNKHFFE